MRKKIVSLVGDNYTSSRTRVRIPRCRGSEATCFVKIMKTLEEDRLHLHGRMHFSACMQWPPPHLDGHAATAARSSQRRPGTDRGTPLSHSKTASRTGGQGKFGKEGGGFAESGNPPTHWVEERRGPRAGLARLLGQWRVVRVRQSPGSWLDGRARALSCPRPDLLVATDRWVCVGGWMDDGGLEGWLLG